MYFNKDDINYQVTILGNSSQLKVIKIKWQQLFDSINEAVDQTRLTLSV